MPKIKEDSATITSTVHDAGNPFTVELAKEILGWEEVENDYQFKDHNGNKIRCTNNLSNRPLYRANYMALCQEILNRRWMLNGEPIIQGDQGNVLNGQHTMIALVLAAQIVESMPESYEELWDEEPYIEKVLVSGISEESHVVNSLDTCRPRSLSDVIYRSSHFDKFKAADRKKISKVCDFAIRLLWERTGAKLDGHSVTRTHAEALDLLERHEKLLECVAFMFELEGKEKSVSTYIGVGYASALLYMMSASSSSSEDYFAGPDSRNEQNLNFDLWEESCQFWSDFVEGDSLKLVKKALANLVMEGTNSKQAIYSIFIKAWEVRVASKKLTSAKLKLEFVEDENGISVLTKISNCGGIDLGPKPEELPDDVEESDDPFPQEEVEEAKNRIKRQTRKATEDKPVKSKVRSTRAIDVGDEVWCLGEDEDSHWPGTVTDIYGAGKTKTAKVKVANGYSGAGNEFEHSYSKIQREKP